MARAQARRQESQESNDICPVCLQPIETDDDVIEAGERNVHLACHQDETGSGETILPKSMPAPPKKRPTAAKKLH